MLFLPPTIMAQSGPVATPWNTADKSGSIVLANSDFDCVSSSGGGSYVGVRGVSGRSAGKLYFEIKKTANNTGYAFIGLANAAAAIISSTYTGNTSKSFGFRQGASGVVQTGMGTLAGSSTGPTFASNSYVQFAIDFAAGNMFVGVDNTWLNSGNPGAGTGAYLTSLSADTYFPSCSQYGGQPETFRLVTAGPFNGTMPSGYSEWG